jgi:hypothetical protein
MPLPCRVLRESPRVDGKIELPIVKLRVVGRNRTWGDRSQAVERRSMVVHTYHAVPLPWCAVAEKSLAKLHCQGTAGVRHGMLESNTVALCYSNGKAQSKSLATRQSRGTAWYAWISLKTDTGMSTHAYKRRRVTAPVVLKRAHVCTRL